jgi:hypothetical protein
LTSLGINEPYVAEIIANDGYKLDGATFNVTMGGTDITAAAYSNGTINIGAVTGNVVINVAAEKQARESGKAAPQGRSDDVSGKKAEAFSDKFVNAMSALQSDPNNASLYKMVTANDEDLSKFLRRTYGAGSQTLPLFFAKSALQTVNPGINLDNLNAGDKVKVPRI